MPVRELSLLMKLPYLGVRAERGRWGWRSWHKGWGLGVDRGTVWPAPSSHTQDRRGRRQWEARALHGWLLLWGPQGVSQGC